ncbi:BirA family biotin operon repressor/biotin-[acetyl-CoA-carboxylase] ligase [Aquabacterium commune]|uniref:biotin--[biotin carboxyl-carrier protein] ligase n=1 Tax=Aquabacterium commune TaxID=70586 RepID=A0A4R6R4Y1_9BURK|nr:biotin--[acetyl-CoA-carboxylase] ligase [Aquabacterium commune]TDP80832.1 BirA family biotin operon repressor/biotin-[acetyl-CoA-carboxylase] ligase [Aquabacterium commune]
MDTTQSTPDLAPILADLNQAAERLWVACAPTTPGLVLDVVPETESTNTALMAQGRRGEVWPTAMVAVRQTAGRGRRGRSWEARPGDTLTFSLGLPLHLDAVPGGGSALSLAVGLALADALDTGLQAHHAERGGALPPAIGLKWPNDLWLGGRKVGGILIEATPAPGLTEGQRWVVMGVGLNVQPGAAVPGSAWLPTPAPSLGDVWGWLLPALLRATQAFERQGFAPLQAAYARRDVLLGQPVQLWTSAASLPPAAGAASPGTPQPDETGTAQGVDDSGALLVHTASGLQRWHAGDVSVRPA